MAEAIGYDGTIKTQATPASIGKTVTGGIGPEGVGKIAAAYPDWGETAQNVVKAGRAYLGYKESVATTDHKNAQQVYQGFYSEGAKATLDDFKARMEAGQWTDEQFNDEWDAAEKRLRADAAAKTNTALKGMFFNQDGVYTRDPSFRKSDDRLWALRNASSEAEKRRYLLNYRQQQTAIARTMGLATVSNVAANVEGAATLADEQLSSDPTINEQQKTSLVVGTIDNVYTRDNATYVEQLKSVTGDEFQAQITDRLAVSDRAGVEKLASDATASIKSIGEKQKALVEYAAEQEIAIAEKKAKNGAISQEQLDYFVSNAEKKKAERLTAIETDMRNRAIDLGRIIRSAKIADSKATLEAMNKASKNEKLNEDEAKRVSDAEVKVKNITLNTTDPQPDYVGTAFGLGKDKTPIENVVLLARTQITALDDEDPNYVENGVNILTAAADRLSGNDQATLEERQKALEDLKAFFWGNARHATVLYGDKAANRKYAIEQGGEKLTIAKSSKIAQEKLHQTIASKLGMKLNDKGLLDFNEMFAGKDPLWAREFDSFIQKHIRYIAEAETEKDLNDRLDEVADKWVNLKGDLTSTKAWNTLSALGGSLAEQKLAIEELARARKAAASKPADEDAGVGTKHDEIEAGAEKAADKAELAFLEAGNKYDGGKIRGLRRDASADFWREQYKKDFGEEMPARYSSSGVGGGLVKHKLSPEETYKIREIEVGWQKRIKEKERKEKEKQERDERLRQSLIVTARSKGITSVTRPSVTRVVSPYAPLPRSEVVSIENATLAELQRLLSTETEDARISELRQKIQND